jgi:hypothetical protein
MIKLNLVPLFSLVGTGMSETPAQFYVALCTLSCTTAAQVATLTDPHLLQA